MYIEATTGKSPKRIFPQGSAGTKGGHSPRKRTWLDEMPDDFLWLDKGPVSVWFSAGKSIGCAECLLYSTAAVHGLSA